MNLLIDIGNTRTKLAVFDKNEIVKTFYPKIFDILFLQQLNKEYKDIEKVLVSSVGEFNLKIKSFIKNTYIEFHELTSQTNLPITNLYETKEQLGKDRIASVVGANNIFPQNNVLVIDFGTAITIDFINNKGEYKGGNISPGMNMRFKSLNLFTKKLPLLKKEEKFSLLAQNSNQAIISGVQNGIIFEIETYINKFNKLYKDLKIIFTGGDAFFFDSKLKNTIFVNSNLNFIGLNRILTYNDKN
ncbi:MAG: type III pantothenate kinase [Bacteroidota bacterium]|nr:type III pantothenate kinase [Bacteroidota bacterium]